MFYPWDIIGHEQRLKVLEEDIRSGNIHHAYLFVGPEHIGKFRVAKSFAAILQCSNNFCHTCPTCIQIEKKCHGDTIELDDDGESVKIATIRDIIMRLSMTPQSNYKILLIENFGRLTEEASNALLKILEEPPPRTLFIFSADQIRDVMPTITSRVRAIQFKKLPDEVLKVALQKKFPEVDSETVNQIIYLSLGRSGRAIKLLSEPETFRDFKELYTHIEFLETKASMATRIVAMQALAQDEPKMNFFLSLLVHHMRRKMLEAKTFSQRTHCVKMAEEITKSMALIDRNINSRLVLEKLMTHL